MITLRDRDIDRLLQSLFGCALFLTVLWLWRLSYTGSCGALVLPAVIWCAIFHGLLQYQLQRRRFVVELHLEEASGLRKWFRRPSLEDFGRRAPLRPARGGPPAAGAATLSGRGLPAMC